MLHRLDVDRLAIGGQSMGSLSTMGYLSRAPLGTGYDGLPIPSVKAAIALSAFSPTGTAVPVQAQTADLDIPGYDATNGPVGATDGPIGTKAWYDGQRARGGTSAIQFLTIESGSHGDSSNVPLAPRAAWSLFLTTHYAVEFLDCHVRDDAASCDRAYAPQPHLSRAVANEYDPDGGTGPSPTRCMTVPDKATLEQLYHPEDFVAAVSGNPPYDCTP